MSSRLLVTALLLACGAPSSPAPTTPSAALAWTALASPTTESLRGLSVVSRDVAWASGAHGTVLRTIDGGETWTLHAVPGAEAIDFRSLHAFDASRAVVLAAGAPARAFRTEDGGASWAETYTRDVPGIFFDSLAFWDEREGLAMGDPLPSADGSPRFALLFTHDGGAHWEEREGPIAQTGEAAFAASNGCVSLPSAGVALFATGGMIARVFRSSDAGASWADATVPVTSGLESAGVFSISFADASHGYVVGGDYAAPTTPGSFARSDDGGATWVGSALRGFRSSIAITPSALIVVGSSGSDVSYDEGASWRPIGDEPLNAVGAAGATLFAVGPGGSLARLALPEAQ